MLQIKNVYAGYGDINILFDINMQIKKNQIVSLVGANGAGKSTLISVLTGILKPSSGSIELNGVNIEKLPVNKIVEMGLIQVPEGRQIFPNLTVLENLEIGGLTKRAKNNREKRLKWIYELFPILYERSSQKAGTLSGGEQQMLAIGRGLMGDPDILILDEPSLGLAPKIVETIFEVIKEINASGKTIFLVEQNTYKALSCSDWAYVIENGSIVMEDFGENLLKNDRVRKAYLGL